MASNQDVPGAGGRFVDGDRFVVADEVGPIIIRRGRWLGTSADVQVRIAGAAGDPDFELRLTGRHGNAEELLCAGDAREVGHRHAVGQRHDGLDRRVIGDERYAVIGLRALEHGVPGPLEDVVGEADARVVAGGYVAIVPIGGRWLGALFHVQVRVAGAAGHGEEQVGLSAGHFDLEERFAVQRPGKTIDRHFILQSGYVAPGGLEGDSRIVAVAPDRDEPRPGGRGAHRDRLVIAGLERTIVVFRRGRRRPEPDVQVGVAGAARHFDQQGADAARQVDAVHLFTRRSARDTRHGDSIAERGAVAGAAKAGQQTDSREGTVSPDHDVPRSRGGRVHIHGLIIAGEERPVVIAGGGRQ